MSPAALVARALLALAVLAGAASAQKKGDGLDGPPGATKDPLTTGVAGPAEPVPAGGLATVTVTLDIAAPWHLYAHDFDGTGTPTALALAPGTGLALEEVRYPPASIVREDALLEETLRLVEGRVEVVAALRVARDHAPGPASATLQLTYQACTDQECLFETVRELPVSFEVGAAPAAATANPAQPGSGKGEDSFLDGPGDPEDPLTLSASAPATPVPAGGLVDVTLTLRIERPWHLYAHDFEGTGTPIAVMLEDEPGLVLEGVRYPEATVVRDDAATGETLRLLEGSVQVVASVRVAPDRAPGRARASLSLDYQACTDQMCQFPAKQAAAVDFEVRAAAPDEVLAPPAIPREASLQDQFLTALKAGEVGSFLWLCVLLAFVSLLTPCVFPMIPITVSFFSKRGETEGGRSASYALAYGGGIVATYTGFGVGMALLLGASSLQSVATNPWVNLAIGALFVYFGLSLMGFYDLRPPRFLARRAESGTVERPGYLPVLVMGFVFTVTAFTCTAPIVGTLLATLASGGSLLLIVMGMLVYSLAFALPFVLLAMFPGAVQSLPGAGGWMITVKVAMGFIELIAALKFLSAADLVWDMQLLSRSTLLLLAVLLLSALGLYLLGAFRLPHDVPGRRRALSGRTLAALGALLAALYFARGLAGRTLDSWTESFLPPAGYAGAEAEPELIAWRDELEPARAEARAAGRPLFVDFTGVTCNNCRKVEKSIFVDPRFAEAVEQRTVPVRLYTDRRSPPEVKAADTANRELMVELGSTTLPLYVLLSADGKVLRQMGYDPSFTVQEFIDFLEVP